MNLPHEWRTNRVAFHRSHCCCCCRHCRLDTNAVSFLLPNAPLRHILYYREGIASKNECLLVHERKRERRREHKTHLATKRSRAVLFACIGLDVHASINVRGPIEKWRAYHTRSLCSPCFLRGAVSQTANNSQQKARETRPRVYIVGARPRHYMCVCLYVSVMPGVTVLPRATFNIHFVKRTSGTNERTAITPQLPAPWRGASK